MSSGQSSFPRFGDSVWAFVPAFILKSAFGDFVWAFVLTYSLELASGDSVETFVSPYSLKTCLHSVTDRITGTLVLGDPPGIQRLDLVLLEAQENFLRTTVTMLALLPHTG